MGQAAESKPPLFPPLGKQWAIAVSVLGLLALGTTGIYVLKLSSREPSAPSVPTQVSPPKIQGVSALGRLEPLGEVINVAPPPNQGGAKVSQLLVQEGTSVKKGQIIAILDNVDQKKAEVDVAQKAVNLAQANLAIIEAGAKSGEIQAQAAIIKQLEAELSGEIATNQVTIARLEMELAGEKQQQTATINRLEAELKDAQREEQRYELLAQDGVISAEDLEKRQLGLDKAQESLTEAQEKLKKTINILSQQITEEKAKSTTKINSLRRQIQEAKATLSRIAEVRPVDVQKAQAEVDQAVAQLKESQEDLDLAYVKAPGDGQIIKIHSYPGEKVDDSNGIVELGETQQMMVIAEVYESDINKVKIGQKANIKSENNTFSEELQGTVQEIGRQIGKKDVLDTDPAANVDVRVIEVKILLDPTSSQRVSNLTYAKVVAQILL
ncbi:ABC exporter membrane fusion protein, DevB family [Rippkaea orientalis PCC 8801]|uniref:ABC exporter membrane fusion protein, DevB family n=1 Tax=Rippkaea orientalis (strain PCC 8801 / RF-1) TaxID=41431 RepID=B7K303_RIPO1|nr:ABC exporter membrane fusion protein [Rippkaea orientalis]ACK67704.1 ABC exporter membrane fusion protein, DevB family [Rippkaea orientalis PCC 8801]